MKDRNDILEHPQNAKDRFFLKDTSTLRVFLAGLYWILGLAMPRLSVFERLSYGGLYAQENIWAEDENTVMGPVYRRRIEARKRKICEGVSRAERLLAFAGEHFKGLAMIYCCPNVRRYLDNALASKAKRDAEHVFAPP